MSIIDATILPNSQKEIGGIKFDFKNSWKIRVDDRSRERMKLVVKLSRDEALAFKSFKEVVQPEDMSDEDFIKSLFYLGFNAANEHLSNIAKAYAAQNADTSGIDPESISPKFEIVKPDLNDEDTATSTQ